MAEQQTMTIEQFGQEIKKKYPQYNDIDDAELGKSIIEKYPEYQRVLTPDKPSNQSPADLYSDADKPPKEGVVASITQPFRKLGAQAGAVLAGGGAALGSALRGDTKEQAAQNISAAIEKPRFGETAIGATYDQNKTTAQNIVQDTGKMLGTGLEIGSYLAPGTIGAKGAVQGAKAATAGSKTIRPLMDFGKAGAASGFLGQTGRELQDQSPLPDALGRIAGATALGTITGVAVPGIGRGLSRAKGALPGAVGSSTLKEGVREFPGKYINTILKPPSKAYRYGKNPGRAVAELGIVADSEEGLLRGIQQASREIGDQVESLVAGADSNPIISTEKVFAPIDEAIQQAKKMKRTNAPLITRLQNLKDDLVDVLGPETEKITPQQAFQLKREIGEMSKWTGQAFDGDLNQARVGIYSNLKNAVEDAVPSANLRKLNQQWGELIEGASALENRMAQKRKNLMISLPDIGVAGVAGIVSGGPGAAIAYALSKMGRSVAFKTRMAKTLQGVLGKMDDADKQVLDEIAPKIEPVLSDLNDEEVSSFIKALPAVVQVLRSSVISPPATNTPTREVR